jgi:hypothetical protein
VSDLPGRVVVALDPEAPSEVALEIARHLSQGAASELLGLFVEDARLLAHAGSALAREIVLTGTERPLERTALERQIRAQAEEQRRRFESAAARLGLRHAFQVARGEWLAELVREATDAEGLVVSVARAAALRGASAGAMRELARAPLRNVLFAREGWSTGRRIVTLLSQIERDVASLEAAARFARATRSPLTVLAAAASRDAELERCVAEVLEPFGVGAPVLLTAGAPAAALRRSANDARLLVLPAPRSANDEGLLDVALALRAPLLLVRDGGDS